MPLYAFHGFLGLPSDWQTLPLDTITPSLFDIAPPHHLQHWGAQLNAKIRAEKNPKRIGLGYSLGGRLLLHALLDDPCLWQGAILISTHIGLESVEKRRIRQQEDRIWANRFEKEPWDSLIPQWESQQIFAGCPPIAERHEKDYSRKLLADALRSWSLGSQASLRERLRELSLPILWIAGERDSTYATMAKEACALCPQGQCEIVPDAGHRVPWEKPQSFLSLVQQFISTTKSQDLSLFLRTYPPSLL
jgi:2-succinyl-6-hydroxy-2,4-cyclohexadiene-1-carboxylate synthase